VHAGEQRAGVSARAADVPPDSVNTMASSTRGRIGMEMFRYAELLTTSYQALQICLSLVQV
jgi:hypothetical protein